MKRRNINKEFKKNSIEQLLESACVQLTRENTMLRGVLFYIIKESNKEMSKDSINKYIDNAIAQCPELNLEQDVQVLRQIDTYKYRANK